MSSPLDNLLAVAAPSFGGLCAIPPFCLADAGRLLVVSWKMLPPLALLPGESLLKLSECFIVSCTRLPLNSLLSRNSFCAFIRCNLKHAAGRVSSSDLFTHHGPDQKERDGLSVFFATTFLLFKPPHWPTACSRSAARIVVIISEASLAWARLVL